MIYGRVGLASIATRGGPLDTIWLEKKKETTEMSESSEPNPTGALVEVVMIPVGLCQECGMFSLWRIERIFDNHYQSALACKRCAPGEAGDLPDVTPANLTRTRISVKPAGHCLKCGKDALWSHAFYSEGGLESTFFCTNCEPASEGSAPFQRSERELLESLRLEEPDG